MKKNGFLTFCFAFVPGAGQMYQGYMKRGASLMFWFFASIVFCVITRIEILLLLLLPLIWAYSFFDTFNLRNLSVEQRAAFADGFIPNRAWLEENGVRRVLQRIPTGKAAGWVCIGLGVLILYGAFWDDIYRVVYNLSTAAAYVLSRVPALAIAALVIALGVSMLHGVAARKNADMDDNDYNDYGGGNENG